LLDELLKGFVVDKACGILGEVKVSLLDMLSELPTNDSRLSVKIKRGKPVIKSHIEKSSLNGCCWNGGERRLPKG